MANDTQAAFDRLIFALQEFNAAATAAHDPEEPSVLAAADALADAYTVYDDAIYTQYGVDTPLDTYDYEDYEEDDLDDEFDDEDLEEFDRNE
ncbi:DNA primase [Trueperella pyogenes]|uniref:DNA primase n=1 Tax=Trueperella pyogenes TaxID=1661 RepID=UPI00216AA241|nr:DNA primase [Trueperella pyogenes]UVJ54849.1 DNA primase [Trueperella pyogenes]